MKLVKDVEGIDVLGLNKFDALIEEVYIHVHVPTTNKHVYKYM